MKLRFFVPSVIFLFCGLVTRAQITEMYYQGFESGETPLYTGPASVTTQYHSSGSGALMISQANDADVTIELSEIDFTQNTALRYISFEFDHMCNVQTNTGADVNMCRLYYKRSNETQWHQITASNYNQSSGEYSRPFVSFSSFSINSYNEWYEQGSTLSNDLWKRERFDLNNVLGASVAQNERRLMLKLVVRQKTSSGASTGKWVLDNLKVSASPSPMVKPTLTMVKYPDGMYYPSSRGAEIVVLPKTAVSQGINPDSVYMFYRVGSDPTPVRVQMTRMASDTTRFSARIPFFGYDTLMRFYCVARDATSNANYVTFPASSNSWHEYRCVRGVAQPGIQTPEFTGFNGNSYFPFYPAADVRSEWVYDSALLASAGYKAGQMTAMRMTFAAHTNTENHNRMQIRMKNVPTNYRVDTSIVGTYPFTTSYMHVVYDSAFTITEANAGFTQTVQFQDTFCYAGKGLVMQLIYDNDVDKGMSPIRMISAPFGFPSMYYSLGAAFNGYDAFTNEELNTADYRVYQRPALVLTQHANLPLLYDMGFDTAVGSATYGLVNPNYDVPMTPSDHSIKVRLKNQGALAVNSVKVSYSIDGTQNGQYTWSGNLAGGAVQMVTIAPNVALASGFHTLRVWVEDTVTAGGQKYRDHEPYNDTIYTEFIVCDGPMNGTRRIGGTGADFATMEEFLFAVSRCGIDDSLVVKLAPGNYEPFTMPDVLGTTQSHYIVFEPVSGNVTFFSDGDNASIVDLASANNIRFRNVRFVRRSGMLTDMVKLGMTSVNCRFEGCTFTDSLANPVASMRIGTMINTGYANGTVVDGCTFVGGKTGVELKGQAPDIPSANNSVLNSTFRNQYDYAVNANNQSNVVINRNEMYDVYNNTMGVLLLNSCMGTTRVTNNKIYTSHGAGAVALNSVTGSAATRALVANNMLVCNDDGTASLMRTPLNVITASYTDVVYNSVKMTASSRNNLAAVSFGGGTLENSRFMNNIVVALDDNNYALNYSPGAATTNTVGYNVYYSLGTLLNRRAGTGCTDLAAWLLAEPGDTNSIVANPNFLNGSLVDLRTYNRMVKGVGMPMATVPTDMFDSVRSTTATCPGAFEFVSLGYDFEPEALISPVEETCYMPSSVELKVRIRNSGVNAYTSGTGLQLKYRKDNEPIQSVSITTTVPGEDTVTIATGRMLQLPSYSSSDRTYTIKVWTVFANDPNATNDTNVFQVVSKYRPAKPNNDSVQIPYASRATVTPTSGVDMWSVYNAAGAPTRKSEIYWYHDTTDAAPFHVGPTLTTDTLRMDSTFYFRQKRAKPVVRITQLEIKRGGSGNNATVGETPNAPYWLVSGRKVALQLTNVGDARANLYGDTIQTISPTASGSSSLNNKIFVFTDSVYIEPGQSLVVQYASGISSNPAMTIHTGSSFNVAYNSKIAFVYRRGGVIEDAVALNDIASTPSGNPTVTWANIGVPSYVWNGTGVNMASSNSSAGIFRNAFNGNASDWQVASSANPMFLGSIKPTWIFFEENGCDGYFASYKVKMLAPPVADIDVATPVLPASECGQGEENVSVRVRNYGIGPVTGLVLNCSDGNDTVTEAVGQTLAANGILDYTFTTPLNFARSTDTMVTVRVWANAVNGDNTQSNDTNVASVLSLYTPSAPAAIPTRSVSYATPDTFALNCGSGLVPVWYDYEGNAVDTGYVNISEILYVGGTRGVSYLVASALNGIVGTGTTTNTVSSSNNTTSPTPYASVVKNGKQQYIYSASELAAAGLEAGYINSIAFELKTIPGNNVSSITFNEYNISMGLTSDTIFANTSDWKGATRVYTRSPFVVSQSDCNTWVMHQFDTPFYWDGVSSIVVQLTHYIPTAVTTGTKSAYTQKPNTTLVKLNNNALSPSTEEYSASGTRGANRPNIQFYSTTYGCSSAITPYTVQMVNIPTVDMAVLWPNGVDTVDYNSCNNTAFYVNVRNQGASDASNTKLYYYFDTLAVDSVTVANTITSGATENVMLFSRHLNPGRHTLRVIVAAPGDNVLSNDTITRSFMVSFCSGSYTIALTGGDYHSFGEAIDTLNVVGIEGPVTFNVSPGTYTEQVVLNNIPGSSATNNISFIGTGDNVLLTAAPSQNENYVMLLDSTSNVTLSRFRIEARPPSGNFANALVLQKGGNIALDSMTVRVRGSINNANASAVVLLGNISNLSLTNSTIDSGYYSFRTAGEEGNYSNITLTNNTFHGFWSQAIVVRGVTNFTANSNNIQGGISGSVNVNGRGLTGIYLAQSAGNISVQKNKIVLVDSKTGGKTGIQFENINCSSSNPALIANNMISCSGIGVAGIAAQPKKPVGICIDSSSSNINVYFNTVRMSCGNPNASSLHNSDSYAFYSGATVSNLHVTNNILANFRKGYAYYVSELNTVTLSDYNAYYTASTCPFAWKQTTTIGNLAALQTINSDDANSVFEEPYFNSETDLHLVMTNFAGIGQYNADVPDDIDGVIRKQVPGPTLGAHELDVATHDMAVVRIDGPLMPASTVFNYTNNRPPNIESDSVLVTAQFYNNGLAPENNVQWYAYLEGYEAQTRTANRSLGSFNPSESKIDSVMMPTILGVTDTNVVHVVVVCPNDTTVDNNDRTSTFFLAPAFNLAAISMSTDRNGCSMQNTTVTITVKNQGFKDMPAGTQFKVGYHPVITQPASITEISTMPDTVEEYVTLATPLLMNASRSFDFSSQANFYPTGESEDIKFRLLGWVNYEYDITPANDSTPKTATAINSYYSPEPPVGFDTIFPYGTWGEVRAMQVNNRPIRWYRDSTATPFYHPSQYNQSRKWSNTPQYFHDSVYYLNCLSAKNCPSFFSEVHVSVAPRVANDMAFEAVLAPLGGRVYMENDTVRVRIANYGTSSQTNVPVAFQLKRGNNIIQNVSEVCRATIPAGQSYVYTFNTLLDIPTPTVAQNYQLVVWTDLASDAVRRNDTIRIAHTFASLAENRYVATKPSDPTFDITRVSFNEIDYETPQQGRGYTDLASYTAPDYPALHVTRGLSDSIFIRVNVLDASAQQDRVRAWVYIDFNRNGIFDPGAGEAVVNNAVFYNRETYSSLITIPTTASPGYMRMRVTVASYDSYDNNEYPVGGVAADKDGHTIDFLLFVDSEAPATDLAVNQIASPRDYIIEDGSPREISVRVSNKGATPVSNPTFEYRFIRTDENGSRTTVPGSVTYPGTIAAGSSALITLDPYSFTHGTTTLVVNSTDASDQNRSNDTLEFEYNRFYVVTLPLLDSFDIDNRWYAPKGYNIYAHNFWELGTPAKQRINAPYSGDKAWVTDLDASAITTGKRGNVSYLYSPIINIQQIRPDTISVRIRRNLLNGSTLRLEFLNYEHQWVNAVSDSLFNWYNNQDDACFDGTSTGSTYNYYYAPTAIRNGMSGDFNQSLQFRFVYTTPVGTSENASFGEGCAIDNFRISRARRPSDAGIVDIVEPVSPAYGQTIYPKVVVRNYGTDTLRSVHVGYVYYGTYLPKECTVSCLIAPNGYDTLLLTSPFIVSSDFPETFEITAFTQVEHDIYYDNDTLTKSFNLSPLGDDIDAVSFVYPLDQAVAGEMLQVTMRVRNFGVAPIPTATATYIINGQERIDEEIDFQALLGRPLGSMEYFNYTFNHRFRAPMGVVQLTGIIKCPNNDYVYNDTISKRFRCVNSIVDIAAAGVIVDTSAHTEVRVTLIVENRGGRGVNAFEVGFYIDDDSSTIYREIYNHPVYALPALGTGFHTFNVVLPQRSALYSNVTAFVHAVGDNDSGNDTTKILAERFLDVEMGQLIVVENAAPTAELIAYVFNRGNVPVITGNMHIDVNINDLTFSENFPAASHRIDPGMAGSLRFNRAIPKSPQHSYVGSASISYINDQNNTNNQTNLIEIRSYWDPTSVPTVDGNNLVLGQNYPNPFEGSTSVPFTLPNDADVHFFVIDAMGHLVNSFDRHYTAGAHNVMIDMDSYPAGIYYYGIIVDGQRLMRKMILR